MMDADEIADILIDNYPRDEHIHFNDPFKVLVRCIISQRNRDSVTDRVSSALFEEWDSPEEIANLNVEDMQDFLSDKGLGLYKNKGEWIVRACDKIINDYNGEVPKDEDKLLDITGIGRKCMNIIMAYGFGESAIPVDTHVKRVSQRIGLSSEDSSADKVEEELRGKISKDKWFYLNHAMVDHGKNVCKSQNPRCEECPVKDHCDYYDKKRK